MVDGLLTPSEAAAARRKCTIVEEEEDESLEEEKIVRDDSAVLSRNRSSLTSQEPLDLALVQGHFSLSKPLIEGVSSEATPAPFPVTSQIGTGLSRQGSLRR